MLSYFTYFIRLFDQIIISEKCVSQKYTLLNRHRNTTPNIIFQDFTGFIVPYIFNIHI